MHARFLFKGVEIDERTQEYILKRLERIEKLVDKVTEFEIEVERDKKGKFRIEIMAKTPLALYRAEDTTESIEGSTDIVIDELEIQISKRKNKKRDLKRRGRRSIKKKLVYDKASRF
ncbi:MAG: ribosomal subunit interface protein [Candidatus Moranbacteria bacterium RIFCSPLOWO2_02_FULL_48_19]|nr:MAG: ribosomal subunit interface protein [Candidatus Moranbacteria bacterium RIFCSPLOWO2_02_FULL_48_19]